LATESRRVFKAASIGLAAVCLVACVEDTPVTPAAHDLIVHAILDAGARDQYVIVQSTDGSFAGQVAVAGATVTMTLPNGATVAAGEEADSNVAQGVQKQPVISPVYHFALDRLGISLVPGGTYQLRVAVPDGRVVTGRTTIPNAIPVSVGRDTRRTSRSRGAAVCSPCSRTPRCRCRERFLSSASWRDPARARPPAS
jgi:hypothetical protein